MTDASDLHIAWRCFADWFRAQTPVMFRAGRGDVDGPLAPLFELVDGQFLGGEASAPPETHLGPAVFDGGFTLSGLDDARREKDMLDTLARDQGWPSSWWSTSWFPFASDGCGQVLVVDADTGVVIEFIHDDDARPVRAQTLAALFADTADRLERGALIFDPRIGVTEADAARRWQEQRDARAAQEAVYAARARWGPWGSVLRCCSPWPLPCGLPWALNRVVAASSLAFSCVVNTATELRCATPTTATFPRLPRATPPACA